MRALFAEVLGRRAGRRRRRLLRRSAATRCWRPGWSAGSAPRSGVELALRSAVRGADRRRRLARRLDGGGGRTAAPLMPQPRPAAIPLSFAQQRLWFLDQLEGPSADLQHPARAAAARARSTWRRWSAALGDVVAGTRACARSSPRRDGVPYQQILIRRGGASAAGRLETVSAADARAGASRAAAARGFDLASELPLRAHAVRGWRADEHVLLLVLHHIAGDGWSLGPLARDLATPTRPARRARRRRGRRCRCSTPTTRCGSASCSATRATRQRDRAAAGLLAAAAGRAAGELDLPTDRPRPAVASYRGDTRAGRDLARELHAGLRAAGARRAGHACSWCCRPALRRC